MTAFKFTATASNLATAVQNVTMTAAMQGSSRGTTVTLDPTPKFYLKGNNVELSLLTNGAAVTPSVTPAGCPGMLTVRGLGYVSFDPTVGTSGFDIHQNGAQNTNTAFLNFPGGVCGQLFDKSSEISFSLKSAHSFAERKLLPAPNARGIFEVYDYSGSMYVFSTSTTSAGALIFSFGAGGNSTIYRVPAGQEDVVFGRGVVAKIKIKWSPTSFSLYINGVLAQTNSATARSGNWSSNSAFTVGSRSVRLGGGGYYASDDTIAELVVR
jgi:hypothetical protein